jgi:hypothetical protein
LLSFALLFFVILCFAFLFFALIFFVILCFAFLFFSFLFFALLCFSLLFFAACCWVRLDILYLLLLLTFSPPPSRLPSLFTSLSVLLYNTSTFEQVEKLSKGLTCVNAVGFHPFSALLVSTSGERQFDYVGEDSGADSDTDSEECESDGQEAVVITAVEFGDNVCCSSGDSTHASAVERQGQGQEQGQGQGQGTAKTSRDERDSEKRRRSKKNKSSPSVRSPPPPSGIQVWSIRYNPIILPDVEVVPIEVLLEGVTEVVPELKSLEVLSEVVKDAVAEVVTSESPVAEAACVGGEQGGESGRGGEGGGGK